MYKCSINVVFCNNNVSTPFNLKVHISRKHPGMEGPSAAAEGPAAAAPAVTPDTITADLELSLSPITLIHPFTMTVSGPTGSGKTWLVKEMLRHDTICPKPDRIVYLYKRWQPLYEEMRKNVPNIEFIRGIPNDLDQDEFLDVTKNNLILCDDMMSRVAVDPKIADLFTEGFHHRNLSVINLTQNLFPPGKNTATQKRNTQYRSYLSHQ